MKESHDPGYHLKIARKAISQGNKLVAHSLLKTALSLDSDISPDLKPEDYLLTEEEMLQLSPPAYARNKRCAHILQSLSSGSRFSLADIGGGAGILSHFLPQTDYMLCEPQVNDFHADDLIALGLRRDFTVCVHVLEHIQREQRAAFIGKLARISDTLLVNCPVAEGGVDKKIAEELIYKHTGEVWAREHLDCTLPSIEEVLALGGELDLKVEQFPGSNYMATLGMVFLDMIAARSSDEAVRGFYSDIKRFINEHYRLLDAESPSGDHFFVFRK